jgi:serine/threonine-protein kinase RsbT
MTLEETVVLIEQEGDIVAARQKGREMAAQLGFSGSDPTLVATAISELARNILLYARRGTIAVAPIEQHGKHGIRVVAHDDGPGIPNIELAMRDGYSTGKSLGLGLPGAKRLMDDFEITSAIGVGTTVTMEKWKC